MRVWVTRSAVGALLLLIAQSAPAGGDGETIHGVVLDPAGRPVAGARVDLRTRHGGCIRVEGLHEPDSATTDEEGRFELRRPAAPMEFYVHDGEHAPAWAAAEDGARIEMKRGAHLTLELPHAARVSIQHGYWSFARGNAEGIASFGPLPAGVQLDVLVQAPDRKKYAATLLLRPGERRTLEVDLERGHEIRGRVTPPLADVRIDAHQDTGESATAWTAADGSFVLTGLDEQGARLVAIAPGKPVLVQDVARDENVELSWND